MNTIAATEAKNRFGGVLRQVSLTGEPILIQRDGKPIAVIMDIAEYQRLKQEPPLKSTEQLAREAFGMWRDREDIDDNWLISGRNQWNSTWQVDQDE